MLFTDPMPFAEAEAAARRRTPVGSVLTSREWEQVPLALRDRAFFSAQQTNVAFLDKARRGVDALVAGKTDRATQRLELRQLAESLGLTPAGGDGAGPVSELGSDARLNLILDTNLRQVQGHGDFIQGNEPSVLDEWPAQELIDTNPGQTSGRRNWPARWLAAGGPPFFGGRMIALKSDPIWAKLSRFGTPYPPFDFNSYWEVLDVDRETAEAAGLIAPGEPAKSAVPDLNASLEASLPPEGGEYERLLKDTFGDQLETGRDGKLVWQGSRIAKLYEQALGDPSVTWSLSLGKAPAGTVAKAQAAGVDLQDAQLVLDADHIRHADRRHGEPGKRGPGTGETRGDQQPLTSLDFELVPHLWREPDVVIAGSEPGTLEIRKNIFGDLVMATMQRTKKGVRLATLYKKKGGTP